MTDKDAKTIDRKLCPGSQVGADSWDRAEVPRGLKSCCLKLLRDEEREGTERKGEENRGRN